ncbi:class I SAM-dependent methyltransferase [Candidatus Bathyarchaeota archaeon]|nr:class I SAM-dependent methyltransferase [Candidatus Bathyarchaeota archaeon]
MLKIKHRFEVIEEFVRGKDVLDVGCVGLGYQRTGDFWVHGRICKVARRVVGVDIQREEVARLKEEGYEVVIADINKRMDLGETFDVINVGQVLTYLTDFDTFFDNIKRHLRPNGLLILSVTNAHSLKNFLKYTLGRLDFTYTNFQNEISMRRLLDRYGFEARSVKYVEEPARRMMGKIYQFIFRFLPSHLSSHIIVIASQKTAREAPIDT